jgi:hypothetical protein
MYKLTQKKAMAVDEDVGTKDYFNRALVMS